MPTTHETVISLRIVENQTEYVCQNGYLQIEAENAVLLFGMSPGNSFFKQHIVDAYVEFMAKRAKEVIMVSPQTPAEHTFRALGAKKSKKKARNDAQHLMKCAKNAIAKLGKEDKSKFVVIDWPKDVDPREEYQNSVDNIYNQFDSRPQMRTTLLTCAQAYLTARALASKKNVDLSTDGEPVEEAVKYILDELAFVDALYSIYEKDICVVYYKNWDIAEQFGAGHFDGVKRPWLGHIIVEPVTEEAASNE